MPGTDIVPVSEAYPALFGGDSDMAQILSENIGEGGLSPFDLVTIGLPAGGGTMFQIPSIMGDDEATKTITGVIVHWTMPRTYWETSLDDDPTGGTPPDCSSDNGVMGIGEFGPGSARNPSGQCETCPMNEWGSDDPTDEKNNAKACREGRRLFVIRPGQVIPMVINTSLSSIYPIRKYFLGLASAGLPFYGVETELGIEPVTSGAFKWGILTLKATSELSLEERAAARKFSETFKGNLTAAQATATDAAPDGE